MLLAVFMTAFETSYVRSENGAVKHSIQLFSSTRIILGDVAAGGKGELIVVR